MKKHPNLYLVAWVDYPSIQARSCLLVMILTRNCFEQSVRCNIFLMKVNNILLKKTMTFWFKDPIYDYENTYTLMHKRCKSPLRLRHEAQHKAHTWMKWTHINFITYDLKSNSSNKSLRFQTFWRNYSTKRSWNYINFNI